MMDIELIRQLVVARLPVRVRWLVDELPFDFDFSRSEVPLKPLGVGDFNDFTIIEKEWALLRIFGVADYDEGGGVSWYLGVHAVSGEIFGLDVERDASEMFLFNSDMERFIQSFLALDEVLRVGERVGGAIQEALEEIDPAAFARSEWRMFSNACCDE